jgi:hypothetical protein
MSLRFSNLCRFTQPGKTIPYSCSSIVFGLTLGSAVEPSSALCLRVFLLSLEGLAPVSDVDVDDDVDSSLFPLVISV